MSSWEWVLETGCEFEDSTWLPEDRNHCRDLLKAVTYLGVPQNKANFTPSWATITLSKILLHGVRSRYTLPQSTQIKCAHIITWLLYTRYFTSNSYQVFMAIRENCKDVCGRDIAQMLAYLSASQLGGPL